MDKTAHIYLNAKFIYKNSPKGYFGIIQDNYSFGKEKEVSFSDIIYFLTAEFCDFYESTEVLTREQSLTELKELINKLNGLIYDAERAERAKIVSTKI